MVGEAADDVESDVGSSAKEEEEADGAGGIGAEDMGGTGWLWVRGGRVLGLALIDGHGTSCCELERPTPELAAANAKQLLWADGSRPVPGQGPDLGPWL